MTMTPSEEITAISEFMFRYVQVFEQTMYGRVPLKTHCQREGYKQINRLKRFCWRDSVSPVVEYRLTSDFQPAEVWRSPPAVISKSDA